MASNKKKLGRKANFSDIFFYMILAIFIGIVALGTYWMVSNFNSTLHTIPDPIVNGTGASISQAWTDRIPNSFDIIVPLVYILFFGFSVWSASKIQSSHKFLFFFLFFALMLGLFSLYVENMWDSWTTSLTSISALSLSGFKLTNFFLSNMRYFVLLYAVVVAMVLYTRTE